MKQERFSLIAHPLSPIKFLITDCPSNQTLNSYIPLLQEHNVKLLLRLCNPNEYSTRVIAECGIRVVDSLAFEDGFLFFFDFIKFCCIGNIPNDKIIQEYRIIIKETVEKHAETVTIAVHCMSGIGRAPLLVVIGLLDLIPSLEALDVVEFVRGKRRGALNKKQMGWLLDEFKRKKKGIKGISIRKS